MAKNTLEIKAAQRFVGAASRYLFPPDSSDWWHQHGSYEILITKAGRIWFEYESFFVSKKGQRTPIVLTKRAKIEELLKEVQSGVMTLKPPDALRVTLERDI